LSIHLAIFGKPRYLGLLDIEAPFFPRGTWLVVETMRGSEIALLGGPLSVEQEARYRTSCNDDASDGQVKGGEPILQEISLTRIASGEDMDAAAREREEEDEVLVKARMLLRNHSLSMKLVDVEYLLDKKKLFFYFTSEQRVDFRAYVRDLAKEFKTRIELRQIGVRDEAKTVKGIAPCGRECCCSHWLHRFTPICIKMVKEQNLALNPTKISGICGRLMCCMSYEHTSYSLLWKSLPNPGAKIRTASGNFVVEGVELSSDSVRVRRPDGGSLLVTVEDFPRFKETVLEGREWEEPSRAPREWGGFESSSGKPTRQFSDESSRVSKRKAGESGGRERRPDQAIQPGEKKSEAKPLTTGMDKPKTEKEKQLSESAPAGEGAVKSAKKKRRRKKTSSAPDKKNQAGTQPVRQQERGETQSSEAKHSSGHSSGDRPHKKNTGPEKAPNTPPAERTEGSASSPEKGGEPTGRRSNSRRRRSGKGGNREQKEQKSPQEQAAEGSETTLGGARQKKQRSPKPQNRLESGEQRKEKEDA